MEPLDPITVAPNDSGVSSVAAELQRESERLRQLAEKLRVREIAQTEMQLEYQQFKQVAYVLLREKFERESGPLPDKDLETLAAEDGALPLEAFIEDLRQPASGA